MMHLFNIVRSYIWKKQLLRPLQCSLTNRTAVNHSVLFVSVAYLLTVLLKNDKILGFPMFIMELPSARGLSIFITTYTYSLSYDVTAAKFPLTLPCISPCFNFTISNQKLPMEEAMFHHITVE
jgi:hypothetical protein